MEGEEKKNNSNKGDFSEIIKKAYEKGLKENEITVDKLIKELKADLKHMIIS
ncbi:hypothetical protein [Neobacillus ginsengisoli]|uniref:Aspartyl-phosphate phosphatase Spo0E family protein n=1 Tax=Neobacillus ginsengisoli TaxID=904295 RepID=A0ABT9XYV2_9BACI|nr:hypothetical protein [Neobacillus ginsengisoli]MDQ0200755.1 hypothetical protein [Neobacillus ginsengisoli]